MFPLISFLEVHKDNSTNFEIPIREHEGVLPFFMIINSSRNEKRIPFDDQGGAHPDDQKQGVKVASMLNRNVSYQGLFDPSGMVAPLRYLAFSS